METGDALSSTVVREARPLLRRVGIALVFGFLLLVAVPTSVAVALAVSGGPDAVAFGLLAVALLGFLLVLAALPVAVVWIGVTLGLVAASGIEAYVTERRLGLLGRVEAVEDERWWGPLVRPTALLGFLDPRTAAVRFEADLDEAKSAYVAGDLSEHRFERELDRLFGLDSDVLARDASAAAGSSPPGERRDRRASTSAERSAR